METMIASDNDALGHRLSLRSECTPKARLIAFYLPQFHPIPENDSWWGPGFTEWTNVAKAKPLFPGHYQPHVPADLGFYDLRVPETRSAQAKMAREAGIEGFCYWHYWFGGKRLLERPFNEVLTSGEPDFPFCLGWANESWSGVWHGAPNRILMEQTYPGLEDYERHFYALLPAFQDPRYIRVEGKPLFLVYCPQKLPDSEKFIAQWQELARRNGLPGIHFVAHLLRSFPDYNPEKQGFDSVTLCCPSRIIGKSKYELTLSRRQSVRDTDGAALGWGGRSFAAVEALKERAMTGYRRARGRPVYRFEYEDAMRFFLESSPPYSTVYPCAVPNWDNSPRSGTLAVILHNSSPELFRRHLKEVLAQVAAAPAQRKIVFVKSWNEWAEGNHLEPDLKYGHQFLDVIRDEVLSPV